MLFLVSPISATTISQGPTTTNSGYEYPEDTWLQSFDSNGLTPALGFSEICQPSFLTEPSMEQLLEVTNAEVQYDWQGNAEIRDSSTNLTDPGPSLMENKRVEEIKDQDAGTQYKREIEALRDS